MSNELDEFTQLSAKVAQRTASVDERARWRELRNKLVKPAQAPPTPSDQPRAHARMKRKLRVGYMPVKQITVTFTDEVGTGGLRLVMPQHLDTGALLMLRLELAGPGEAEALLAAGRVAWSRREGGHFLVGVEFVGLRPEERERVEAFTHAASVPDLGAAGAAKRT